MRIEPQSPTWRTLRAEMLVRIENHQKALEDDLAPEETAKIRGRIAELRSLIEAVEPARPRDDTEIGSPLY